MDKFFCCCLTKQSEAELQTYTLDTSQYKIEIITKFRTEDVEVMDKTPMGPHKGVKYCCPVCMRFFSAMLEAECCRNYLCHLCANELMQPKPFLVRCPHCNSSSLKLRDVGGKGPTKKYSDSPATHH
mmetsp:Transcript_22669/g.40811  ORF Transcript_22669/g.40811 Transcript_22669/m.40811 type:complete len:127 (+) Transcript_22669:750-1130(+)